jgi:hypothetical protein
MTRILLAAVAASSLLLGVGASQARPDHGEGGSLYAGFDVRNARNWTERLVLCDTTAFLASRPNLNADRMWVRRDDGRRDLLLPPYFLGGGRWYKEGYQRLFWRLQRRHQASDTELFRVESTIGRRFIDAYRDANPYTGGVVQSGFLDAQDRYCRNMARAEGEVVY